MGAASRPPAGSGRAAIAVLLAAACLSGARGRHQGGNADAARGGAAASDNTLNIYNWADYIAPDTIANFERETGIKVRYATFESNEVLETKLLTGHTGYDIVVPSDIFFERLMRAGVFRKLDKTALPNAVNLDPEIMAKLAVHDPGNQYGLPYLWTTTGIGYDVEKIRARLGPAPPDSWSMLFDPKNAAKLQDCGILIVDSPLDVLPSVLLFLGKDPNSRDLEDLAAAGAVLMRIRPYVRSIEAVGFIGELANGSLCAALTWGGDVMQARYRALEAANGVKIRYFVPREGAAITVDMIGIPADAPHPAGAEKFLNYLMLPQVMAGISNAVKYPNGNAASLPLVNEALRNDREIYLDRVTLANTHALVSAPPEYSRAVSRLWTRFRTGQ